MLLIYFLITGKQYNLLFVDKYVYMQLFLKMYGHGKSQFKEWYTWRKDQMGFERKRDSAESIKYCTLSRIEGLHGHSLY